MTTDPPICYYCSRFRRASQDPPTCDAYPRGIPTPIWESDADHRLPYAGDNGVTWHPFSPEEAGAAERLLGPLPVAAGRKE